MGKDRDGNYHPPQGKPSGVDKSEGTGLEAIPPAEMKEYKEITEEYIEAPDEIGDNVHVRHQNRNPSKGEQSFKNKEPNPERDRTQKERQDNDEYSPEITELPIPLSREVFKELAVYSEDACVSVFMDTHDEGMEVNEDYDSTVFKNAITEAAQLLKDRKIDETRIERMLTPAYELLQKENFWKNMEKGLGVFISNDRFSYMKMNTNPGKKVVVDSSYYVLPLISMILNDKHFFLLDISKGGNRFFKGSEFGMEKMEIDNMPSNIKEEVADTGVSTVFRSPAQGSSHGSGDGAENDKVYLEKYLRQVDEAIWKQVANLKPAPLLLSGVEYVTAMYKDVSKHQYILDETLTGNHQHDRNDELFRKAIKIVKPYLNKDSETALEQYGNLSATEKTSDNIEEVISASYYGKIENLFVKKEAEYWGTFDEMKNKVSHLQMEDENAEDLVDNTVVNTIINGGDVFILEESMPDNKTIAATFRY